MHSKLISGTLDNCSRILDAFSKHTMENCLKFPCSIKHIRRNVPEFSCLQLNTPGGMFKTIYANTGDQTQAAIFTVLALKQEFTRISLQEHVTDQFHDNFGCTHQYDQMYSLLSGLWKYMFQKDEFFVLILGLDNAGKTTFLEQTKTKFNKRYKGMNLGKVTTTVGLNIGKIDLGKMRLNFWDLGGQDELQSLWDKYYAESHAVIYVVDSSDRDRIEESKTAFDRMIENSALHGVPLLLLANKQDLDGCLSVNDIKHVFNPISEVVGHRDCQTDGVSALRGDGVQEGINWLAECIKRNIDTRPPTQKDIT